MQWILHVQGYRTSGRCYSSLPREGAARALSVAATYLSYCYYCYSSSGPVRRMPVLPKA